MVHAHKELRKVFLQPRLTFIKTYYAVALSALAIAWSLLPNVIPRLKPLRARALSGLRVGMDSLFT
jgi:hypothetical protein